MKFSMESMNNVARRPVATLAATLAIAMGVGVELPAAAEALPYLPNTPPQTIPEHKGHLNGENKASVHSENHDGSAAPWLFSGAAIFFFIAAAAAGAAASASSRRPE